MAFGHLNSLEWQAFYPLSHFQATPYLNCIFVKVKSFILRDSRSEDRGRIMQWLFFVVFETRISKIQLVNGKKKVMYRTTALDHFASSGRASVWTSVFTCLLLILGTPERFKENHLSDDFNTRVCEVIGCTGALDQVLLEQRNVYLLASVEWVGTEGQELVHKAFYHLFFTGQLEG